MPSHPIDFTIQTDTFSTPEAAAIFAEKTRFNRWLRIEAALATAQSKLGIIPQAAADEIKICAHLDKLDIDGIAAGYKKSRNTIMPVVKALRKACRGKHGEFVHYGATTQDILDTSQILELQEVINILFRDLKNLESMFIDLCRQHKTTPMIGRTHGQQALPITFGFKTAGWLAEVRRHIERLKDMAPRVLVGQLSGAVGTMAALGPQGREVSAEVMGILGLGQSIIAWHTLRDNIAEIAAFCSLMTASIEKIASEIFELGKTEIGELREPAPSSSVSSSTMPHKRNPVICQRVAVLCRHTRALATTVNDAMIHAHERDARSLWTEMLAIPQIAIYSCTAVNYIKQVISKLEVNEPRMLANLYLHKEMVASEWLLFRLGREIGKMQAQEILHGMFKEVTDTGKALGQCLADNQQTSGIISKDELTILDNPEKYCGLALEIVDDVIADTINKQRSDPESL